MASWIITGINPYEGMYLTTMPPILFKYSLIMIQGKQASRKLLFHPCQTIEWKWTF